MATNICLLPSLVVKLKKHYANFSELIVAYLTIRSHDLFITTNQTRLHEILYGTRLNGLAYGVWKCDKGKVQVTYYKNKWHGKNRWILSFGCNFFWVDHRKNGVLHGKEYKQHIGDNRYLSIKHWKEGKPTKTHTWWTCTGEMRARITYFKNYEHGVLVDKNNHTRTEWKSTQMTAKGFGDSGHLYQKCEDTNKYDTVFDPMESAYEIHIYRQRIDH